MDAGTLKAPPSANPLQTSYPRHQITQTCPLNITASLPPSPPPPKATAFTALSNASLTNLVAIMGPLISDQSLVVGYVSNVYKVPMFDLAQTGAISIERFPYFVRGRPSTATQASRTVILYILCTWFCVFDGFCFGCVAV